MNKIRIYLATGISNIGNWLTFLAIALLVKEKFGVGQVSYTFMVQSIIPLLFSQTLVKLIPQNKQKVTYLIVQVLFALSVMLLIFNQSLTAVYIFLIFTSFLKTLSNPLFNSLISNWVDPEQRKEVYTRVGAINSTCLALAPLLGGYISLKFGYKVVFILDAFSFLLPVFILLPIKSLSKLNTDKVKFDLKNIFRSVATVPKNLNPRLVKVLVIWFIFLNLGACINGVEFAIFESVKLTKDEIGLVIGMWGLGCLVSFFMANKINQFKSSLLSHGVILFLAVCLFVSGGLAFIAIGFFFGGYATSIISGSIRSSLQESVGEGVNPLPIWAFSNQLISLSNIICYAALGFLSSRVHISYLSGILVFVGMIFLISLIVISLNKSYALKEA